ncbi:unnamed protein product [Echinostoma caproni]|uniref:Deacetylase sirtuin-type domain-containing protein n=1 Tax=Echinostoma caproni TaxID=27848 RepID=A0A183BCS1_9TREM|nr:unnamed protein product [Echinostoma caproni]
MSNIKRPSSNVAAFREILSKARNALIITGAGISAESGVPTFRGAGGLWRNYNAQDLATLNAFCDDPGLVWEFYHYRRELVRKTEPNPGHVALVNAEKVFTKDRRSFTIVTQNVDGLHLRAGSKNVIELHGTSVTEEPSRGVSISCFMLAIQFLHLLISSSENPYEWMGYGVMVSFLADHLLQPNRELSWKRNLIHLCPSKASH